MLDGDDNDDDDDDFRFRRYGTTSQYRLYDTLDHEIQ